MSNHSVNTAAFSGTLFLVVSLLILSPTSLTAQVNDPSDHPLNTELVLIRAMTHAYAGDLADAESILRRGLDAAPDNASLLSEMAYVKEQMGTISEALFFMSLAVQNDSVHVQFSTDLARLQVLTGDVRAAVSTYSQAIHRYPSDVPLRLLFAKMLIRFDRLEDALLQIDSALQHPEFRIESLSIGADLARMLGRDELLESYESELVRLDPFGRSYPRAMAELFMRQGRWEDAVNAFERAMELDPENTDVQEALHVARARQDRMRLQTDEMIPAGDATQLDSAFTSEDSREVESTASKLRLLKASVQMNPGDTNAIRALADAYLGQSEFADAAPLFRRIVDLDPRNLDAWRLGIESYVASENLKMSLTMSEDALLLFPGYVPLMILRVHALEQSGQLKEAVRLLETLIERSDDRKFRVQLDRIRSKIQNH